MDEYLHNQTGTSDKVYSLHLRPTDAGRWAVLGWNAGRGHVMQPQFKIYDTVDEAKNDFWARFHSKKRKGYEKSTLSVVWPNSIDALVKQQGFPTVSDAEVVSRSNGKLSPPNKSATSTAGAKKAKTQSLGPKAPFRVFKAQGPLWESALPRNPNLAIPAWILACFYEVPLLNRDRAVEILGDAFPNEKPLILLGSTVPESRPVDWMRAIFSRLPIDARKRMYRKLSFIVHSDQGGTTDLQLRWIDAYARFDVS